MTDGPEGPRLVRELPETEMDRMRNSIVGVIWVCTAMVCVTAIVCCWILH